MEDNNFLPNNYQLPAGASNYLKLATGATKFRILSKSITGWEDWTTDRKPLRTKDYPEQLIDPSKPAKHFWAFVVWDYKASGIKILELTQRTIQDAIIALYQDENWGNPQGYDITINKTGEKMETKYNVMPTPPKPLSDEIRQAYSEISVNLEALYSGGDPFATKQSAERQAVEQAEINSEINQEDPEIKEIVDNIPW